MIWVDYAIVAIVAVSAIISVIRGFVREALSLAGLIAAIWIALTFFQNLTVVLNDYISAPSIRMVVAFAILFIVTLLLAGVVNHLAARLVKKSGLTGTDRMLGMLFGLARGAVIVAILVLLAGLTPVPRDPWWRESLLIIHFENMALWLRDFLPPDIGQNFVFDY